jgi:predicted DNA-binding transcriptional regulator AlpA
MSEVLDAPCKKQRRRLPQPLELLKVDEALLTPATVDVVCGLRKTARNIAIARGAFPAPTTYLSATEPRWQARVIREWLQERCAKPASRTAAAQRQAEV